MSKSETLCTDIASLGDTCFLGFSRGKDSIASWIRLKQYFKRIIPFHCAPLPGLNLIDDSLKYYEEYFKTKIYRFIDGECLKAIASLWFQNIEDEDLIDDLNFEWWDKHYIVDHLRKKFKLPNAWCAYGINATDNFERRIYVNKLEGRVDKWKSFYPCYDFTKEYIIKVIKDNNIKLPEDYKYATRTFSGMFTLRGLENLMNGNPTDFNTIETYFPFIKAIIARNKFREEISCQTK